MAMDHTPDVDRWAGHPSPYIARVAFEEAHRVFDERTKESRMTENGATPASDVERTFAGILSELEDVATTLTKRENELARELADVQAELHRVEAVRAAMVGQPTRSRQGARTGTYRPPKDAQAKIKRVEQFAAEREEFTGAEVAELLGTNSQGVGPLLAGMVRRGTLAHVRNDDNGRRIYSAA